MGIEIARRKINAEKKWDRFQKFEVLKHDSLLGSNNFYLPKFYVHKLMSLSVKCLSL